MDSSTVDPSALVAVPGAENVFQLPALEQITVGSGDHSTVGVGHAVEPGAVFDRDTLIAEYTISNLDTPETNIAGAFDPFYEYLDNSLIKSYLAPFGQINFGLVVTVRLVVPGSCYGVYNVQCLCDGGVPRGVNSYDVDGPVYDAYPNSTQDVHAFLNVDIKNSAVFELPWEHYNDSYPLSSLPAGPVNGPGCWRILIWGLSPIQNTLTNTPVSGRIQIYARMMPNRSIENLTYQSGKAVLPSVSGSTSLISQGVSGLAAAVPSISAMATPVAKGLAALSTAADYMGFTRDSAPMPANPQVRRMVNNLAPVDSEDSGEIVALSVANSTTIDPAIGGGESDDPMAFAALFDRWTIIDTFNITEDSVDTVRTLPVTPYAYNQVSGIEYVTTGGWAGTPFANWRGGMEYKIYIPSSSNIQGSLQVLWDPNATGPAFTSDPTNLLSNVVIDLKGTSSTIVKVDYSNHRPSLQSAFVQSGATVVEEGYTNGRLVFRMNAPLTAPRVTGFTVGVIVMARPAQDMTFGNPTGTISTIAAGVAVDGYTHRVVYQSGVDERRHAATSESVVCLNQAKSYPCKETLFGEDFRSVRAFVQKLSPLVKLGTGNEFYIAAGHPHFAPPPTGSNPDDWAFNNAAGPTAPWTWMGFYSAPFSGVRGSTRTKVLATTNQQIEGFPMPSGRLTYNPSDRGIPGAQVHDRQTIGPALGGEFLFPFYGETKYTLAREIGDATTIREDGLRFDYFTTPTDAEFADAELYIGAGPDFTATRFRRIPGMRIPGAL